MPGRRDTFHPNGIYHVFNRTIDKKIIFNDSRLAQIFLDTLYFYHSQKVMISFSQFRQLRPDIKISIEKDLSVKKNAKINILAYCLMPTHFHLLIQELHDSGILTFMSDSINSFTRYYNLKINRKGPLFLPRFQSREIVTEEILMHVSRYLHLNPYSSGLVKKLKKLVSYPLSSYSNYITIKKTTLVDTKPLLQLFDFNFNKYRDFVENQADYQKSLEEIKYIEKW